MKVATINGHALRRSPANSTPNASRAWSRTPPLTRPSRLSAYKPTGSIQEHGIMATVGQFFAFLNIWRQVATARIRHILVAARLHARDLGFRQYPQAVTSQQKQARLKAIQLLQFLTSIRSASPKSGKQWPFSREAERVVKPGAVRPVSKATRRTSRRKSGEQPVVLRARLAPYLANNLPLCRPAPFPATALSLSGLSLVRRTSCPFAGLDSLCIAKIAHVCDLTRFGRAKKTAPHL